MSTANYIVIFKPTATEEQISQYARRISTSGGQIGHRYDILKGFSATLRPEHLRSLQADDIIDYIEPDQTVTTQ